MHQAHRGHERVYVPSKDKGGDESNPVPSLKGAQLAVMLGYPDIWLSGDGGSRFHIRPSGLSLDVGFFVIPSLRVLVTLYWTSCTGGSVRFLCMIRTGLSVQFCVGRMLG